MSIYKKWVILFLTAVAVSILFNWFIWKTHTEALLNDHVKGGDLTRVGYIAGSNYAVKESPDLALKHIENDAYANEPIDVLTIGDSFSNGLGVGREYYQDWIATHNNFNVLNIQNLPGRNNLETILILYNSGYLDGIKSKFILIERVERDVIESFSKTMNPDERLPIEEIKQFYSQTSYQNSPPKLNFMNIGNLKFILYRFLYHFKDNAFFSKVHVRTLDRPFFSVENGNKLIFADEDITHIPHSTPELVKRVNDNLNFLARKLSEKGIKLYFMPIADKYNLYSDHILDNPYPKSAFFEELRKLNKNYYFVDTKTVLLEEIRKGEKDIYYADDTHWSWKAARKIFETVHFE
jgi:hypothetical protein